jgi:hypothetical protein
MKAHHVGIRRLLREREQGPGDSSNSGTGQSVFKALEGIGLHLEPSKAPAEYIAIDRVERPKPNDLDVPDTKRQEAAKADKFNVVSIKTCPDVSIAQTGRGSGPDLAQTSPGHVLGVRDAGGPRRPGLRRLGFPLLNTQGEPLSFEPMRERRATIRNACVADHRGCARALHD